MKMAPTPSGSSSKNMVFVSLAREEVKLNQVDSAWKPSRFKKDQVSEDEFKTQVRQIECQ